MHIGQLIYENSQWKSSDAINPKTCDLVICFLSPGRPDMDTAFLTLHEMFENAAVIGCTTGGEIQNNEVLDDAIVAMALDFQHTGVRLATAHNDTPRSSFDSGVSIARQLKDDGLTGVFILSEGLLVNGSKFVQGLRAGLPEHIPVSGGLAGDGPDFGTTRVGSSGILGKGNIVAVGFYGDRIELRYGCAGGWDIFGPDRIITRSVDNILYELDGKPALELYKRYLGEEATRELPGSALLYPIRITDPLSEEPGTVRTVLGIDETSQSLTFAGDMPEGYQAQLMTGRFDGLITGAHDAAKCVNAPHHKNSAAILVSCIGRKLTLNQRTFEEVEEAGEQLGARTATLGFYSYGELCKSDTSQCTFHNQTMTITHICER